MRTGKLEILRVKKWQENGNEDTLRGTKENYGTVFWTLRTYVVGQAVHGVKWREGDGVWDYIEAGKLVQALEMWICKKIMIFWISSRLVETKRKQTNSFDKWFVILSVSGIILGAGDTATNETGYQVDFKW